MIWDLYEARLGAYGTDPKSRQLEQAREDFLREAPHNPAYHIAKRNGVDQRFLLTRSETPEKYKIVAFPDEDLAVGDYIDIWGERFIVYQIRVQDTLQKNGMMWLTNFDFRWQNFSSDIIVRRGVLDSGVYSSTIRGDVSAKEKDKQFKAYLPFDEDTSKLFIDKRLASDIMYDRFGNQVLNAYRITGFDSVSESFGRDGHLLVLNLRSDNYNREKDNVEHMICDYISNEGAEEEAPSVCEIQGSEIIRLGTTRKYHAKFFDSDGNEIFGITPVWNHSNIDGVSFAEQNGVLAVTVADAEHLMDETVILSLTDSEGTYAESTFNIDIIGL